VKRKKQIAFLKAYRITANITGAERACKLRPGTHHDWMQAKETIYRKAFLDIQAEMGQILEDEALRRAHEGVKRMQFYKGKPLRQGRKIVYETEYSDQLLVLLLKGFLPEKYRERTTVEHSGSIDLVERLTAAKQRLGILKRNDGTIEPTGTA
jgi:hypothetical protein